MGFVLVVLSIVAVAVGLYFVAAYVFGPGEPPPPAGEPIASPLPQGRPMTARDLRSATFPVTMRGYRMADVDALIERMAREIEQARTGTAHLEPEPSDVEAEHYHVEAADQPRAHASDPRKANPMTTDDSAWG